VLKVGEPQNNTYIEYCAMENMGGKIQFMIWSGALIPRVAIFFLIQYWENYQITSKYTQLS
jgi:hypothetical protein